MNNETLKYNILVIDDDPLVLEDAALMYKDMIFLGDFDDILGKEADGSVSSAKNTKEAERILQTNFKKDPRLVQLLHVDERMPGELGSGFVDRMRWAYAGRRIGALLVTGYATDVSVAQSREKGVYRYVPKPVTPSIIKPHLDNLVKVIFSREKPRKKELNQPFLFKRISDKDELTAYFRLRYSVYDFMNYIGRSNEQKLDIDAFDFFSLPLGCFAVDPEDHRVKPQIVATLRIVLPEKQEFYANMIEQIERGNEASEKLVRGI
jgi:CheY-like chemotaxis protein